MSVDVGIQRQVQECKDQSCLDRICREHGIEGAQKELLEKSWNKKRRQTARRARDRDQEADIDVYLAYNTHLRKSMGGKTKSSIHEAVTSTWRRLNFRSDAEKNTNYGLVVGRIQSGKTAHMLGLALKALQGDEIGDAYDTIIILAGTIDDLRKQTLERIQEVGIPADQLPCLPEGKDLTQNPTAIETFEKHIKSRDQKSKMVLVIKKNVDVLEKLNEILDQRKLKNAGLKRRRIMVIDDECDFASMDSNNAEDDEDETNTDRITATNKAIRTLLIRLRKCRAPTYYIGYTATPYANVLMQENSSTEDSEFGESLFPRNFIHALTKPEGHLDNEQYFLEKNQNIVYLDASSTHDLEKLLYLHVISLQIKKVRGIVDFPHISMVHTDPETREHAKLNKQFQKMIDNIKKKERSSVNQTIMRVLNKYHPNLNPVQREKVLKTIEDYDGAAFLRMFTNCEIIELNRRKQVEKTDEMGDKIEETYTLPQEIRYQRPNLSAIVIGGVRVSRGLTLKGLTNTWFTRTAFKPNYDTMLQMARWCGYRTVKGINYNDLVRIFTTRDIANGFSTIAGVERALRDQLELFSDETDPVEERIWIQQHDGFRITGRMPSRLGESNIFGEIWATRTWTHQPPIFGHADAKQANKKQFEEVFWKFYSRKMRRKHSESPHDSKYHLFENPASGEDVQSFLENYLRCYPSGINNDTQQKLTLILNQLKKLSKESLATWNVVIRMSKTKKKFTYYKKEFGLVGRKFNSFGHGKLIQSGDTSAIADIGNTERTQPLLLLYLADMDHESDGERVFPDDLDYPVLLLGIVLPNNALGEGGHLVQRYR